MKSDDRSEVARLEAEVEHWKAHAEEAGRRFARACRDAARISAWNVELVRDLAAAQSALAACREVAAKRAGR